MAEQVGCSVGTIRKIERDVRRPSKQLAELLATELDIPADKQAAFITFVRTEAYTADMSETLPDLRALRPDVPSALVRLIEAMLIKEKEGRMSFGDASPGRMRQLAAELDKVRDSL